MMEEGDRRLQEPDAPAMTVSSDMTGASSLDSRQLWSPAQGRAGKHPSMNGEGLTRPHS